MAGFFDNPYSLCLDAQGVWPMIKEVVARYSQKLRAEFNIDCMHTLHICT